MGTETFFENLYKLSKAVIVVKLNNPLMGTETRLTSLVMVYSYL